MQQQAYELDAYGGYAVAEAPAAARATFIRRTYAHLVLAILAFVGVEAVILNIPGIENVFGAIFSMRFGWLLVLGGFMLVSWLAERWAMSDASPAVQYAGLGLYVVAQALLFAPILWICSTFAKFDGVIAQAALMTLAIAGGLTLAVLVTRQDFSFLGPILSIGGFIALGLIVAGVIFGFTLGLFFAFAMVAFACGAILYHTSNVLHRYRTDQYVAAALALFASVALLFWYILQIFMRSRN